MEHEPPLRQRAIEAHPIAARLGRAHPTRQHQLLQARLHPQIPRLSRRGVGGTSGDSEGARQLLHHPARTSRRKYRLKVPPYARQQAQDLRLIGGQRLTKQRVEHRPHGIERKLEAGLVNADPRSERDSDNARDRVAAQSAIALGRSCEPSLAHSGVPHVRADDRADL